MSATIKTADAERVGETGAPHSDAEHRLFIAYMKGHCWKCGPWDEERSEYINMHTRVLYAVWRARGALAAAPVPPQGGEMPELPPPPEGLSGALKGLYTGADLLDYGRQCAALAAGRAEPDPFKRNDGETPSDFLKRMHALHDETLKGQQ